MTKTENNIPVSLSAQRSNAVYLESNSIYGHTRGQSFSDQPSENLKDARQDERFAVGLPEVLTKRASDYEPSSQSW